MNTTNTMTMEALDDEMLEQVVGGSSPFGPRKSRDVVPEETKDYRNGIHPGCGGRILHQNNPFVSCECDKCGKKNYWYSDFFDFQEV